MINENEIRTELEKAMQTAKDNIKYSLECNSDDKYWAAQGAFTAYRHAIAILDAVIAKAT